MSLSPQVLSVPAVKGKPFSAKLVTRGWIDSSTAQPVTRAVHQIIARDSFGRTVTRGEMMPPFPGMISKNPEMGIITDTVSMVRLVWFPGQAKVVMKAKITGAPGIPGYKDSPLLDACDRAAVPRPDGVTPAIEDLGEKTIQNIRVHGCPFSFPLDGGTDMTETWVSRELRLTVGPPHRNSKGSENGDVLEDIILGEPDSKLFMPPPGYLIQDADH